MVWPKAEIRVMSLCMARRPDPSALSLPDGSSGNGRHPNSGKERTRRPISTISAPCSTSPPQSTRTPRVNGTPSTTAARKTGGEKGWAERARKRRHFAWEYKGKHDNLDKALAQLQRYAVVLDSPPLLIVSDMQVIKIHTNWTYTVQRTQTIHLHELLIPEKLRLLKWAFTEPERLNPEVTREAVTNDAARKFARLAEELRSRGHDAQLFAHFINRILCRFAQSIGLLPPGLVTRLLETSMRKPKTFEHMT